MIDMVQPGTHFYHGHYGMQRSAGLYGSLIIDAAKGKREPLRYDGEFNLLLSDWWHESVLSQELGLSAKPMRWIGEAQVIYFHLRIKIYFMFNSEFIILGGNF